MVHLNISSWKRDFFWKTHQFQWIFRPKKESRWDLGSMEDFYTDLSIILVGSGGYI